MQKNFSKMWTKNMFCLILLFYNVAQWCETQAEGDFDVANSPEFDAHLNCVNNCGDVESLPNDCEEVLKDSQKEDGVYVLKPSEAGLSPFGAFCIRPQVPAEGWTIIQRRQDGSVDFYRKWRAYKNGFGNLSGEYWLGLERIHALTSKAKYELRIELTTSEGDSFYANYEDFKVGRKRDHYELTFRGYSGTAGNALERDNGMKFSTLDKDHDEKRYGSCAEYSKGAWWYNFCSLSNLNGEYKDATEYGKGGMWWLNKRSLRYIHMAIRKM